MTKMLAGPEGFDLLTYFLGQWTLDREVVGMAVMRGVATFTAAGPDAAAYFEMVAVHLADGQVLHGEQRYIYERTVRGLEVYFHPSSQEAGGDVRRLFHELRFVTGQDGRMRAEASHLCREDLYLSNYVIDSRESFTVGHSVRGPRKNYVVRTSYRRE